MSELRFTIPGEPMGKGRPRVTKFGAYTPKKTVNYEVLVKEMFAIRYPGHKPVENPVLMEVQAYFSIPKSATKKKKKAMAAGSLRPTKKPDLSNITKIIEDALNKIAYNDDSQIVKLVASKYYVVDSPRVEVSIKSLSAPSEGENLP